MIAVGVDGAGIAGLGRTVIRDPSAPKATPGDAALARFQVASVTFQGRLMRVHLGRHGVAGTLLTFMVKMA